MEILYLTLGPIEIASSRSRVFQYFPYLQEKGIKFNYVIKNPYLTIRPSNTFVRIFQRTHIQLILLHFFILSFFYKILFLQKVHLPRWMIFTLNNFLKKKIIYDFDDAIYITETNKQVKRKKLRRLQYTLKKSFLIVVENDANVEYSKKFNNNIIKITGPIECRRYCPSNKPIDNNKIVIGWIGSSSTTTYLDIVRKPLTLLAKKYPQIEVLLIGASPIQFDGVKTEIISWNLDTELQGLSKMDIGIMPLFNDQWSNGKGGYKLLQYMAMGLPSVVSNVGINAEIVSHGENAYLANTEEDWYYLLEDLIINPEKRFLYGQQARNRAIKLYSFEYYTNILLHAIQ